MKTNLDLSLELLNRYSFRRRFYLQKKERENLQKRGIKAIIKDSQIFIQTRLSKPAENVFTDGRQTPRKWHPVFIAQHATATSCRRCLKRGHQIEENRPLFEEEAQFVEKLIMSGIFRENKRYE